MTTSENTVMVKPPHAHTLTTLLLCTLPFILLVAVGCVGTSKYEATTSVPVITTDEAGEEVTTMVPVDVKGEGVFAPYIVTNDWGTRIGPKESTDVQINGQDGIALTGDRWASVFSVVYMVDGSVAITYGSDKDVTMAHASYDPVSKLFTLEGLGADPTTRHAMLTAIAQSIDAQAAVATGAQKESLEAISELVTELAKAGMTSGASAIVPDAPLVPDAPPVPDTPGTPDPPP